MLTPHEGEFARLFKAGAGVLDGRIEARAGAPGGGADAVRSWSSRAPTPSSRRRTGGRRSTRTPPPDLATAGSGDVLTGVIAGLLAQGMAPFEAACAGVWIHAEAGAAVRRGADCRGYSGGDSRDCLDTPGRCSRNPARLILWYV